MSIKKIIIIALIAIVLITGLIIWGISSPPELKLVTNIDGIKVGDTVQLEVESFGLIQEYDFYFYASENPEIVSLTDRGLLIASGEGETTIHIQSKENHRQHLKVKITVNSTTVEEIQPSIDLAATEILNTDAIDHFSGREFTLRNKSTDVLSLATVTVATPKDAFLFTDVYQFAAVNNGVLMSISDWGNDDVYIDTTRINDFDAINYFADQLKIDPSEINSLQLREAYRNMAIALGDKAYNLQNRVKLSSLSPEYEYRVSIVVTYKAYMIVDYYNEGKITDIQSFLGSVQNYTPETYLKNHTYCKINYEIEIINCDIVVEKRGK